LKAPLHPSAHVRATAPNWQLRTDSDAPEAGVLLTISIAPGTVDWDAGCGAGLGGEFDAGLSLAGPLGFVGETLLESRQALTNTMKRMAAASRTNVFASIKGS
jgi:hypothetical protein